MSDDNKIKDVPFRDIGRRKQHKVTLIGYGECKFDIAAKPSDQSYAESMLADSHRQALEYLKNKGFDDATGLFHVVNGGVERWTEGMENKINAMPLVFAIKERDKKKGQAGEFLAALIDHKCRTLLNGGWPPDPRNFSAVLDLTVEIQHYFFQLYLLDNVHPQYSAGKSRVQPANEARNLLPHYQAETKALYKKYTSEGYSKNKTYSLVAEILKEKYPKKNTPKASTIESWDKQGHLS